MKALLRNKDKILLAVVLVIAAFLRLYKISDYLTFLGDEGRDALVAYNILHGHLTLLGPTSSVGGFFLGPIYYYFMAPFLWLFHYDPTGPAVMVGLFGVLTVWFVYKIGCEFFNKNVAFVSAILYAISPVVIAYSRSSWNPNLMPIFTLFTLYALYKAVSKNNSKLFILSGILFGITMQLHYLAVFVGIIIALYIISTKFYLKQKAESFIAVVKYTFSKYVLFLFGFIIGWSPFLAFEVRHNFTNIRNIIYFILFPPADFDPNASFGGNIYIVTFRLFGRVATKFPPPEQVALGAHFDILLWYLATILLGLVSIILFFKRYKKALKNKGEDFLKIHLLFIWFVIGTILFGFYRKSIYDHYLEFLFPIPVLFVGNTLDTFFKAKNVLKIVSVVVFVCLVAINLSGVPFLAPANRQLTQVKEIAQFVVDKSGGKPYNFALISAGNSDFAYRYYLKLWKKDPVEIQTLEQDPKRTSVTDQLLIVCEDPTCQPLGNPSWEVAGFGRGEIVQKWDVSVVSVYKLVHYKGK